MRILSIYNLNQVASLYGEELARRGHLVGHFEPSLAGAGTSPAWKLARMPERILDLRRVIGELRPARYDLAHIHWASYGVLGLASRIPYIVECHGSDVRYRLRHPLYRALMKTIFQRAAGVHCITPDLLAVVQAVYPEAQFFPGPVDTERFAPEPEESEERRERPWTILLFTRLDPIKGPELAVEGIARFARRHPEARVQLLNWGKLKETFKARYSERFTFLEPISPREVPAMLRAADVVVGQCTLGILSFCELQAMSCARPVIVPFRYPEVYPTPPPICQVASAAEIDASLEKLFQQRELAGELGQRARAWAIENHGLKQLAIRLETRYRAIL